MKRLDRVGSVVFVTVLIGLTFHLLAMSFHRWKKNICNDCDPMNPLSTWYTSLTSRCYQSSVASIFFSNNDSLFNASRNSFISEICLPNQYLMVKDKSNALHCLSAATDYPETVCSLRLYNQQYCRCDYPSRAKAAMAFAILTSLSLGLMVFLSHLVTFIKKDSVLNWLIPICFSLLSFAVLSILITLIITGTQLDYDIRELHYSWTLIEDTLTNKTEVDHWREVLQNQTSSKYDVQLGWSFGLEILSLQFTVVSLVLYALMFLAKRRPETFQ